MVSEPREPVVPKNPIEFFLLDLFCDDEIPFIKLDPAGNTNPHTGYHLFNSSEIRPALRDMLATLGFERPVDCWNHTHLYFKYRFGLAAVVLGEGQKQNPYESGEDKKPKLILKIEKEREKLRKTWPIIPSREEEEADPECKRRILAALLSNKAQREKQGGSVTNSNNALSLKLERVLSPMPQRRAPNLPSNAPTTVPGSRIIPPQVPRIPPVAGGSQLMGTPIPVQPLCPVPGRKRRLGDFDSRAATPINSGAGLEPMVKKKRKVIPLEEDGASQAGLPSTQAQVNYPGAMDSFSQVLQPTPSYPSVQSTTSLWGPIDPAVTGFDWAFSSEGHDNSTDGSGYPYSQPTAVGGPGYGKSRWQNQGQGDLYDGGQLGQHFNDQYPPQDGAGSSSRGQGGIASSGQTYPRPPVNIQPVGFDGTTRPTPTDFDLPILGGSDWSNGREAFVKSAMTLAGMMFDNYPWCKTNPPWIKLYEISQSEEMWNSWVGLGPSGYFAA